MFEFTSDRCWSVCILLLWHIHANCQQLKSVSLQRIDITLPCDPIEARNSPELYIYPESGDVALPLAVENYNRVYYYSVPISSLFSLEYMNEIQIPDRYRDKRCRIVYLSSGEAKGGEFIIDSDLDGQLSDEEIAPAEGEEPVGMEVFLNEKGYEPVSIPLSLLVALEPAGLVLHLRNLTRHLVKVVRGDTLFQALITHGAGYSQFVVETEDLEGGRRRKYYFRIGEPFIFNDTLRVLEDVDLVNNTINFRTLGSDQMAYGYREGYYVNVADIQGIVDREWKKRYGSDPVEAGYYLFYFWAPWLDRSLINVDFVHEIQDSISGKDMIRFVSVPMPKREEKIGQLDSICKLLTLDYFYIPEIRYDLHCLKRKRRFESGCHLHELLTANSFPLFILVDRTGKILYRSNGRNDQEELFELLRTAG